jgi:hypothetical protein
MVGTAVLGSVLGGDKRYAIFADFFYVKNMHYAAVFLPISKSSHQLRVLFIIVKWNLQKYFPLPPRKSLVQT